MRASAIVDKNVTSSLVAKNLSTKKNIVHESDHDNSLQQPTTDFNFSQRPIYNYIKGFPEGIQPKLTINEPGDKYEQEADSMADKVMRMEMPEKGIQPHKITSIQRKCAHCEEEEKKKGLQRKEISSIQRQSVGTDEPTVREGEAGDVLKAVTEVPVVANFVTRIGDDFRLHLEDTWNESLPNKFGLIAGGLSLSAGLGLALYAAHDDPEALDFMLSPLSGAVISPFNSDAFPFLLRSFALEVNFDSNEGHTVRNFMGGLHFDVGRLLPDFLGFGPVEEWNAIGAPWDAPVQRKSTNTQNDLSASNNQLDTYVSSLSGGKPLSDESRDFYESRFGYDFSNVRIHDDAAASKSAQSINALAYTHGNNIVFNSGQYSPQSTTGKRLLGHELVHTIQQTGQVFRKPDPKSQPKSNFTPVIPKSSTATANFPFFKKVPESAEISQYYLVSKGSLKVYNTEGKILETFSIKRPAVNVDGYYLGNPFYNRGWGWIAETAKDNFSVIGVKTDLIKKEIEKESSIGKFFQEIDAALFVLDWIKDADISRFWACSETKKIIGMVVVNSPASEKDSHEAPIIDTLNLPDWFKEIKKAINEKHAEEKKADSNNELLPESITFYSSDQVQAIKGKDAWTIQVNRKKQRAFYTLIKQSYENATSKQAYIDDVWKVLKNKIKLINEEKAVSEKEIAEIDGSGIKLNKFAWAFKLKQNVEERLARQKELEPKSLDFPSKLTLSTSGDGEAVQVFFRVNVQKGITTDPSREPEIVAATITIPLTKEDTTDFWVPVIRQTCDIIRTQTIPEEADIKDKSEFKNDDENNENHQEDILPAYPARIFALGRVNDRRTTNIATNIFRMVVNKEAIHGPSMINLVTIEMNQRTSFRWSVTPLPEQIKSLHNDISIVDEKVQQETTDYVKRNKDSLGTPIKTFDADFDWDQEMKLPVGDWMVVGSANVQNKSDGKLVRATSRAGFPITSYTPETLLETYMQDELGYDQKSTEKPTATENDFQKISELRTRETDTFIEQTEKLRKFIDRRYKSKIPYHGNDEHDALPIAIKKTDETLFNIYMVVKHFYGYSTDDLYAIEEYLKELKKQKKELEKLQKRSSRLLNNKNIHSASPKYKTITALVKEKEGQIIPVNLVACWHKDTVYQKENDASKNSYRFMLLDVTFDSAKADDMVYVGEQRATESEAIASVYEKFGIDNHYGDGDIAYAVPGISGAKGSAKSVTKWYEYLEYAVAAIGVVLLIASVALSLGTTAPVAAGGIAAIVAALGISVAVVGAVFAARNIYKRHEKGTLEMDAGLALDVISIIGAAIQPIAAIGKAGMVAQGLGAASRASGVANNIARIQRLERLIHIYDWVEIGANAILVNLKVEEDLKAIRVMGLDAKDQKEMEDQVAREALQQNAIVILGAITKGKETSDAIAARVENSKYRSMLERNFIDAQGKLTKDAPPYMHEAMARSGNDTGISQVQEKKVVEPGMKLPTNEQGVSAFNEANLLDMGKANSAEKGHEITVTERGRIIRCSDFCTDLRLKYGKILSDDPSLDAELTLLEKRAKTAAEAKNKPEANQVANDAAALEARMIEYQKAREELFGGTQEEWDQILDKLEEGETSQLKGGKRPKIDGVTVPTKERRLIDGIDLMTDQERSTKGGLKIAIERIKSIISKKISDVDVLSKHWDDVKKTLMNGRTAKEIGKKGMIELYEKAREMFWRRVRNDKDAVAFLEAAGFKFENEGAPMAVLGSEGKKANKQGVITDQERRISLDHILEKAQGENWEKALDADNLEMMFQNANSWKEIVQVKHKMRPKQLTQ